MFFNSTPKLLEVVNVPWIINNNDINQLTLNWEAIKSEDKICSRYENYNTEIKIGIQWILCYVALHGIKQSDK